MMAKLVQPAPLETKPPSVRENQGGSVLAVQPALDQLGIAIFWVSRDHCVIVETPVEV